MSDYIHDVMKKIQSLLTKDDFQGVIDLMDRTLEDHRMDRTSTEFFKFLEVKIMAHRRMETIENDRKDHHLRELMKCNRMILDNKYSYLNPHARIHSEYQIKHVELELAGIPWEEKKEESRDA